MRIPASELQHHIGERVTVAGWVHNLRLLGRANFLLLRDATGIAQVFMDKVERQQAEGLLPESVVEIEGTVVAEAQARGGVEVHQPVIRLLSPVLEGLPFPINKPDLEAHLDTFLDHASLGLRHPKKRATFELSAGIMAGYRKVLGELGFVEITTPKIVESATESGANVFSIDYFGRPAFLAQSPQFYKQILVGVFERVFEVAPVFRAEPHATIRHINEYVSLDAEMGFIRNHLDVMAVLEQVIRGTMAHVQESCAPALALLEVEMPAMSAKFPHIYFPEAQDLIFRAFGEDCRGEPDLAPQHERWLGEWAMQEFGSDFLFVTGYPMVKRPFYTHPNPEDPTYSNSFDLLFRGTELVTGGQRLHLYADYLAVLAARGMNVAAFEGYLEAFRYGMPPHGGFAIGLERFVMQLTRGQNLREAALFPRDLNRLAP
jgi:nondiscriminating aspartyl-tRNA synthetase